MSIIAVFWRYLAHRERKLGKYTLKTQLFFSKTWKISSRADDFLSLVLFKRDRGLLLANKDIELLRNSLRNLSKKKRLIAEALLLEKLTSYNTNNFLTELSTLNISQGCPPILLTKINSQQLTVQQRNLCTISTSQHMWREQLYQETKGWIRKSGICVVGNAGIIRQLNVVEGLESASCIVRFNQFASNLKQITKVDIWVLTPSFSVDGSVKPNWVFLSGPELQNRLVNWDKLIPLIDQGVPIITLPLEVWRSLVKILKAPPSAGVAFLAFLYHMLGSWQGIHVAGFSALSSLKDTYHISNPKHKPSKRHNWEGEAALLRKWQSEGLTSIHD